MNKFIPLFLGLMFPLAGALADDFTDQAVEFCRSKGGAYSMSSMVEEGDNYCRQVTCKKTNNTDGKYEIPEGSKGPEANVEATKRVCIAKSIVDGNFSTNGAGNGTTSGAASGSNSGSNSGVNSGSASGSTSGAAGGAGVASGAGAGGAGEAVVCEELEGEGRIQVGGLCYEECRPKAAWWTLGLGSKKSGFERKSCVECLLRYPGVYRVKREYLPRDESGHIIGDNTIDLGKGVTVKTGVIVCKDAKGNIVTINGQACPSGTTISTGAGVSGSTPSVVISGGVAGGVVGGASSGNGGLVISGGVAGGVGGVQLPSYCHSTKQKDIEKCQEWMQQNKRFLCASSANPSICMGGADAEIMARYDASHCVNCAAGSRQQSTLSGIAEIVGAIAPPLAQFGSAYMGAKAYERSNEAWAGAAAAGFQQCQLSQNNYLQYLSSNELPGLTPEQRNGMNCNGYALSGYAGLQNPALGGWYGAGYTPGFVAGMMGPYGMYNPYGAGGYVGGVVGGMAGGMPGGYTGGYVGGIGMTGGYAGGYPGGYVGGMTGGYVNGISIAGGINGGYVSGVAGGYPGGYAGGYVGGVGMTGGYAGGYPGGYAGGYTAGVAGGYVNGISIAGGINGGMTGGYTGGYTGGGYVTGGYMAGGYTPGGYAGGYMAGGMNGGYPGGYAGGMSAGQDYASSQQASNYDRMMQQQGTSFQMGMGGMGGMGTGYGSSAYYSPMNAGVNLGGTFGISGGFTGW